MGLQEEKAILFPQTASEEAIKKTALQDVNGVPDPGGQASGPGRGEYLCVFWMKLLSSNPDGP